MSTGAIVYWTFAIIVTICCIPPLMLANLGGYVILLPVLPAGPAVVATIRNEWRVRRELRRWLDAGVREADHP